MTCQTPWSCKMSQPKMQTQARHSSFGTVQMEKCLRQTCCWTQIDQQENTMHLKKLTQGDPRGIEGTVEPDGVICSP